MINVVFIVSYSIQIHSFEVETHRELSQQAILSSTLDDFLKTQLDFPAGIQTSLDGDEIIEHIAVGSIREDDGLRFLNHFHNPLRTWNHAGLLGSTLGASSVIWGQNPGQGFAWQNARDEYFLGLTATTEDERERHLAKAFRALGQVIHLVQDAAQPAHTRNDPHPIFRGFEGYVDHVRLRDSALFNLWIDSSIGFSQTILTSSPNPLAPIPVARIIDTTDPDQASAFPSAGTDQGIAEYTNANFLSEDTIFKDFTFPRASSLGTALDGIEPVTGKPRRYFPKVADGETVNRFVAEGVWWETLISLASGDQGYILDRGVYEDYADLLLPRAIGYSAGLIDYFFRGRMAFYRMFCDSPCYDADRRIFQRFVVRELRNTTQNEPTGDGLAVAVVPYRRGNEVSYKLSAVRSLTLTEAPQDVQFDFTGDPIPFDIIEGVKNPCCVFDVIVVFKGPLGLEEQAVMIVAGIADVE